MFIVTRSFRSIKVLQDIQNRMITFLFRLSLHVFASCSFFLFLPFLSSLFIYSDFLTRLSSNFSSLCIQYCEIFASLFFSCYFVYYPWNHGVSTSCSRSISRAFSASHTMSSTSSSPSSPAMSLLLSSSVLASFVVNSSP